MWCFWIDGYEIVLFSPTLLWLLEQKAVAVEGVELLAGVFGYSQPAKAGLFALGMRAGFANQLRYLCLSLSSSLTWISLKI